MVHTRVTLPSIVELLVSRRVCAVGKLASTIIVALLFLPALISQLRAQSVSTSPFDHRFESSNRPGVSRDQASSVYASALNQYQTDGDEALAITNFKFCIAVDPSFAPPYRSLADMAFLQGDIAKTVYWAERYACLDDSQESQKATLIELNNLRLLAVLTSQSGEANGTSRVGDLSTTSNAWKYLALLGNSSFRRGEYKQAQNFYRAALRVAPSEEADALALAIKQCETDQDFANSLKQARAEAEKKHYHEAFEYYLRAHQLLPENKDCLIEAIAVGLICGRYLESQKLFSELLMHLKPDDSRKLAGLQQQIKTLSTSGSRVKGSKQVPNKERKRPTLSEQFLKNF